MSVLEQWAAFSEQNTDAKANAAERSENYKGFELKASAKAVEQGFAMRISIARHNAGKVKEVIQTPEWKPGMFSKPQEALDALIIYGRAIVDHDVPCVDVSALFE